MVRSDNGARVEKEPPTTTPTQEEEPEGEFGLKKYKMDDFVPFKCMPIHLWNKWVLIVPAHVLGFIGFYLSFTGQTHSAWGQLLFFVMYGYVAGIGVTAGCHRLWTHKSYKANKKLEILLMIMQTGSLQHAAIKWCRDHRIHHKYTDTNADPHNSLRGFWFCHVGWVLEPEHPDVLKKEKTIPMSDLEDNPILVWQAKYYWPLVVLLTYIFPCTFIYFVFPQEWWKIICINNCRLVLMNQVSFCVNSVAHMFGEKPYDKGQSAVDNKILAIFTVGEAWHNYHHCFPWDYKTSELPFYTFNASTAFIDFFAWLGWATDLKTVPQEMIQDRARRTGDGSHPSSTTNYSSKRADGKAEIDGKVASWGWGDKDMADEAIRVTKLIRL